WSGDPEGASASVPLLLEQREGAVHMRRHDWGGPMQIGLVEPLEAREAEKAKAFLDFFLEDLEDALDARGAGCREPIAIEPADADGLGAERDRLHHIGAAAEA